MTVMNEDMNNDEIHEDSELLPSQLLDAREQELRGRIRTLTLDLRDTRKRLVEAQRLMMSATESSSRHMLQAALAGAYDAPSAAAQDAALVAAVGEATLAEDMEFHHEDDSRRFALGNARKRAVVALQKHRGLTPLSMRDEDEDGPSLTFKVYCSSDSIREVIAAVEKHVQLGIEGVMDVEVKSAFPLDEEASRG